MPEENKPLNNPFSISVANSTIVDNIKSKFDHNAGYNLYNFPVKAYGSTWNYGPLASGLSTALLGAGIGFLGNGISNFTKGRKFTRNWLLSSLIGGGIGGGIGYAGNLDSPEMKKLSFMQGDGTLETKIFSDSSASYVQRQALADTVSQLPLTQYNDLQNMLSSAGSAGITFLIARYLFNSGLKTALIVSLLKGALNYSSNHLDLSNTDFFGRKRLF